MFNIKFKGNYESDDQLIRRKKVSKEATEFAEVTNLCKEFCKGFVLLFPLIFIMICLTYIRFMNVDYHIEMNIHIILSILLIFISTYILKIVHEIIHALFYPLRYEKEIWKSKEYGVYFVYCERKICRTRYIVMCLAPMFLLGVIPFTIWLFVPNILPMPYNLSISIIFWIMTIMSMGDVANTYHVIKEVPKNYKIFNHGFLRSFYIYR